MNNLFQRLSVLFLLLISIGAYAGMDVPVIATLDGSRGQMRKDSMVRVDDAKFFDPAYDSKLIKPYQVMNMVTLEINENSPLLIRSDFMVTARLQITTTDASEVTHTIEKDFTVRYNANGSYAQRATYHFGNAYRVDVKIISIDSGTVNWPVSGVLMVTNQLQSFPKYNFNCNDQAVQQVFRDPSVPADTKQDELPVWWAPVIGADEYDVEWAYVDSAALADSVYGNPSAPDIALVFENNASRVTVSGTSYKIPLLYDNKGKLFFRVRSVQWSGDLGPEGGRIEANWSSGYPGGLGMLEFDGHEQTLNWQATTTFAEEGKRKSVVQYYDGSLRARQTVTRDNVTGNSIVAESLYDYQGRPVIQVLPVPTLKNAISYNRNFNRATGGAEYDKSIYDTLADPSQFCNQTGLPMENSSGAARYYSPDNDSANSTSPIYKYIPDAEGFPFTELVYTQDATGRISRQGGVGPAFRIGSGHETRYYYSVPEQRELDALFGTDAGDRSHYFKTMVRDANGQFSVSYTDMTGKTIATALAGDRPDNNLEDLPSKTVHWMTEKLSDPASITKDGLIMESSRALNVAKEGMHYFNYKLSPETLRLPGCEPKEFCYDCLYDLQITITDDCNNQNLGGQPFDTLIRNFSLNSPDTSCNNIAGFNLSFSKYLPAGVYQVTKKLVVSQSSIDLYRDSFFLKRNLCKSLEDFIREQRQILQNKTGSCIPTCSGCIDSLGTFEQFWLRYKTSTGIADKDTAEYKVAVEAAYQKALDDCNLLCDAPNELEATRMAMLGDMTPPSGQYANLENLQGAFSIFKDIPSIYMKAGGYKDEAGKTDSLWDPALRKMVPPSALPLFDFADNFKSSWAEALLPYHPEYCRYQKALLLKGSYEYDRNIGKVEKYAEAKAKGYLNPTGNTAAPFNFYNGTGTVQNDPLSTVLSGQFKALMENTLLNYRSNGTNSFSLWSVVAATVGCDQINEACLGRFGSGAALDTVSSLCEADRDIAWQTFRQLYLNMKRKMISDYLKVECPDPSVDYLFSQGYHPHFFDPADMIRQNNMPDPTTQQESDNLFNEQKQKLLAQYDANCRAYVDQWLAQLSDCKFYSPSALRDTIIPKLIQVCKEGSDVNHPMGASSVKPGSTNQYKSFEQVIDEYNQNRGISADNCNSYMITAPAPYGQQPGYTTKPVVSKPDTCECQIISNYHNKYIQVSESYTSFSDFMKKVYATDIRDSVLNVLVALCNGEDICLFADIDVALPPAFQCNTGEVCIDCEKFKTLENEFRTRFPGVFPVADMTVRDSVQQSWNKLYEQFFNAKLGYVKDVSEYLAFANLCQGKWRSPGCDSLNRIVHDFKIDQQQHGAAADCAGAFRTLFNTRMNTSFTSAQIDSVYFRTCGKGLEICGIRDSLLKWVAVYDSTRQKNYGVSTSYAVSDSIYTYLPGIVKNGVLQLPDAVRAVSSTDLSDIRFKLNYGNFCWQSGYMMETRFKFLSLPANGDILRVDVGNLNCVFERTANGVHMKTVSDNKGMVRNFGSGIGDTVNKLWDPAVMQDWVRIKVIVSPARYYVYFNSTLIFDTVHNGVIANASEIKISPVGRNGMVDWMKLTDLTNQVKYLEDFITPDRPALLVKSNYCPTAPPDCKPGFASWYNQLRGSNLSFQQIDSVYLLFTGRSLNVCYLKDSLNNLVQQFNREKNPTRVQISAQSTNHASPSPYYVMTDPEQIIEDGHMHFSDTLRLLPSAAFHYHHISTPTGVFCVTNGYAVEVRFRNLKNLVSGDLFYYQDANWKFTISNQTTGSKPGVYLGGFLERNSETTRLPIAMQPYYIDPNPNGFSDNWYTLKLVVTKQKIQIYYNGNFFGDVYKQSSFPLQSFNVFTLAYRGYQGATDYVKMFNNFNEEMFYEEFTDRYTRSIIKPSFICPTPPANCQSSFVTFYNQQRGANYTYAKIDSLYYAMNGVRLDMCGTAPQPPPANYTLCGRAAELFPEVGITPVDNCYDSTYFINSKAKELYRIYLDSLRGYFDSSYKAKCLEAYKFEQFTVRRQVSEHHFTLYYYDQAGNLVKTVPPAGVRPNYDSVWLDNVDIARKAEQVLVPDHELTTNYRYNTLNQVVAQKSPDGGLSKFWYDRLGRLSISQNAKQYYASSTEENRLYSYTKYDDIGRITEVGQVKNLATNGAMLDTIARTPSLLDTWMIALSQRREQITSTVYDQPYGGFVGVIDNRQLIVQRNLRNRVSYTTYTNGWNTANYNQGTFYTYDIHGNVDTLLQDYGCGTCGVPEVYNVMNQNGNRFKKISYNFDLISGKVNSVAYQKGWNDQFFHRYSYDGENRLTLVETSLDGYQWEKDARYQYYLHGPLARTILGNQQVQGIDYAYTLQGWLKGVNSVGATDSFDIGGDGKILSPNRYVARDAYGFALNYYGNEYKPINSNASAFPNYSGYLNTDFRPLFNGNISSMVSTNRIFENPALYPDSATLLFNYTYDQLNRITGMEVFNKFNRQQNKFDDLAKLTGKFKERVSYDANGNILSYLRNTNGADPAMDDLTYQYYAGTNRLKRVTDNVPANKVGNNPGDKIIDIDNQVDEENYVYDSIGNLIQDKAEKITNINWNVYGKIVGISRTAGTHVLASEIGYTYDAGGNRIGKAVTKNDSSYHTWYVRDGQGNVMATYSSSKGSSNNLPAFELEESERYLYGSSRLGVVNVAQNVDNSNGGPTEAAINNVDTFWRGLRAYELSNHLGNVLVTISDKKKGIPDPITSSLISHFEPIMLSGTDYYPFGMPMRVGGDSSYRYGFNGKENDNEVKGGEGLQQDYGMRVYDNRLGKFLSEDPLTKEFPFYTPYQFAGNKPVIAVDLDGEEEKIVINQTYNGKESAPVKTLTSKDAEFATIIKNYPKELKGVQEGVGELVINKKRYDYFMNIGNPNVDEYLYYSPTQLLGPSITFTHYISAFSDFAFNSPRSPMNWTLKNWGVNSVGVGIDISMSKKLSSKVKNPVDVNYQSAGGELKANLSLKVIDNNRAYNTLNTSLTLSMEGGVGRGLTSDFKDIRNGASWFKPKPDAEVYAYFLFSSDKGLPKWLSKGFENVFTAKIFALKIQHAYNPETGKFEFKIGISTDRKTLEYGDKGRYKMNILNRNQDINLGEYTY